MKWNCGAVICYIFSRQTTSTCFDVVESGHCEFLGDQSVFVARFHNESTGREGNGETGSDWSDTYLSGPQSFGCQWTLDGCTVGLCQAAGDPSAAAMPTHSSPSSCLPCKHRLMTHGSNIGSKYWISIFVSCTLRFILKRQQVTRCSDFRKKFVLHFEPLI